MFVVCLPSCLFVACRPCSRCPRRLSRSGPCPSSIRADAAIGRDAAHRGSPASGAARGICGGHGGVGGDRGIADRDASGRPCYALDAAPGGPSGGGPDGGSRPYGAGGLRGATCRGSAVGGENVWDRRSSPARGPRAAQSRHGATIECGYAEHRSRGLGQAQARVGGSLGPEGPFLRS